MRLHEHFEWHDAKARTNLRKHGVSFRDAAIILADPDGDRFHLERPDDRVEHDEERWLTIGSSPARRSVILVVVWTDRSTEERRVTRIISARHATRPERHGYEKAIFRRQVD